MEPQLTPPSPPLGTAVPPEQWDPHVQAYCVPAEVIAHVLRDLEKRLGPVIYAGPVPQFAGSGKKAHPEVLLLCTSSAGGPRAAEWLCVTHSYHVDDRRILMRASRLVEEDDELVNADGSSEYKTVVEDLAGTYRLKALSLEPEAGHAEFDWREMLRLISQRLEIGQAVFDPDDALDTQFVRRVVPGLLKQAKALVDSEDAEWDFV